MHPLAQITFALRLKIPSFAGNGRKRFSPLGRSEDQDVTVHQRFQPPQNRTEEKPMQLGSAIVTDRRGKARLDPARLPIFRKNAERFHRFDRYGIRDASYEMRDARFTAD